MRAGGERDSPEPAHSSTVVGVGRHTVPGSGRAEPDRGFWARVAVGALVLAVVAGWAVVRFVGDGHDSSSTTSGRRATAGVSSSGQSPGAPSPAASSGTSISPSPGSTTATTTSASASPTSRVPTLSFTVRRSVYLTISIPGGRTLVSRTFAAGATGSFDQLVLKVVNGRPDAVRFLINGKPHKPGPATKPETFTARRS